MQKNITKWNALRIKIFITGNTEGYSDLFSMFSAAFLIRQNFMECWK